MLTPAENTDKIKEKNGQFMHQRSHVLQLEEEVQRAGSGGTAAAAAVGRRERAVGADVADLALDKQMLQDVLQRKF